MTNTIRLLSLYPVQLDLNGDLGNVLVLKRALENAGHSVVSERHELGSKLTEDKPDFVFLGHGSNAAWKQIGADLDSISETLGKWFQEGTVGLAVASGHEACHTGESFNDVPRLGIFASEPANLLEVPRVSKFELIAATDSFIGEPVLGYLNSATNASLLQKMNNLIGTQLHGPVLAKNPKLVAWITNQILLNRSQAEVTPADLMGDNKVQSILDAIWALETKLASE